MNAKERRNIARGQRVGLYMTAAAEDFPAGSKAALAAASLDEKLVRAAELDVERSTADSKRQQGTAGRGGTRTKLRTLVDAITDTSQTISLDHADVKGIFSQKGKDNSDQTLIATARYFADRAASLVGLFVEAGLPSNFIQDLRSLADSLEHYMSLQTEGTDERAAASTALEECFQRIAVLVERLDTFVHNKYRDAPAKLVMWERVRRIESAPHSNKGDDTNQPTPPPAD
jgi:hypothetical protein